MDLDKNTQGAKNVINKYGVPTSKVNHRLLAIKHNTKDYRPNELARDLVKLAFSIDPQTTVTTAQTAELDSVNCNK